MDDPRALSGARIVLAVTGGIAAYKAAELARAMQRAGAEVQPLLTPDAERLITRATFAALTGRRVPGSVWDDPAAVEHVALARWADVIVVAPATANTLAKLAHGLADDLVTNTALAFPGPLVVAPAMHTEMWEHPATAANLATLTGRGAAVVQPASGQLTSGDTGVGRLAEPGDIIAAVAATLATSAATSGGDLAGTRVLVTMGGTREPLDPVRWLGNRSSGRMGAALVAEALRRGAEVVAVAAATSVAVPPGARVIEAETAHQLYDAVMAEAPASDVMILAAAVADFRPKAVAATKIKKADGVPEIVLEPTPDILAGLGRRKRPGQTLVGFAAETDDLLANADQKLRSKRLDLVVANDVAAPQVGFAHDTNAVTLLRPDAEPVEIDLASKRDVARAVIDTIISIRHLHRQDLA
jgi:phosphopantothenoylcysteine decarboxylase/phosphopantothenate--cysteine ligase